MFDRSTLRYDAYGHSWTVESLQPLTLRHFVAHVYRDGAEITWPDELQGADREVLMSYGWEIARHDAEQFRQAWLSQGWALRMLERSA